MRRRHWGAFSDGFGDFFGGGGIFGKMPGGGMRRGRRGRMFEAGEMRLVILRLIREKPRHGYEIMKALEERMGGAYTPSAGSVYPTLQLLEDQGYVRIVEEGGKKIYHITPEGEAYLDQNVDALSDIGERLKDALHGMAGGAMGDVNMAFAQLAKRVYRDAWRSGPDGEKTAKIAEILRRTVTEIEGL